MIKSAKIVLPLFFFGYVAAGHAAAFDCEAKRIEVENLIEKATDEDSAGLHTALQELRAHCSNNELLMHAQKKVEKLQRKIDDKQSDIEEVKADLQESQAKSDTAKVAKYTRKISEKQADLEELTAELKEQQEIVDALKNTK
ncbi:DUF1090 family protein [Apirhabdus apintestini]|uniref:DUF1090 family protein n=1 Tax=Erwinia sp. HR93 TaxID=3094840 RepID=UPI002ADEE1C9|nr:DUF1090 family protein [Erwinia sp. HR93]MEA1064367.1 DUF1090 family protein [Erwinia sp. HR93]WPM86079.1 DUF1090 family protein [Enterobacteriaceae bacterium CA-0114]